MAGASLNESRHFNTIILGAGMSGLACASKLHQHRRFKRKNSLLVLEGRNRIGGRINSVHVKGSRLDTGANWIHGTGNADNPNPLLSILPHKKYRELSGTVAFRAAEDRTCKTEDTPSERFGGDEWVHIEPTQSSEMTRRESSDLVVPADAAGPLTGSMWSIVGSLHEAATATPASDAKNTSMLSAITKTKDFQIAFQNIDEQYHGTFGGMLQFLESMEAAPLVAQSAEYQNGTPGLSLLEFAIDDFDGDQVFLQDGYIAVIEEVAKELIADGLIELEQEVQKIHWDRSPVTVKTSKATYTADQVVCSLPLGVLQHHQNSSSSLFNPPLPEPKQQSIKNLGFGTLDKIFLVYTDPWWKAEPYSKIFQKGLVQRPFTTKATDSDSPDSFMGFTTSLPGLTLHASGEATPGPWLLSIINLHNLTGFPVLCAFISCSNAVSIEGQPDSHAQSLVHNALTSWLGIEPPLPEAVHVTRWAQDEFSRGSYSHMITGVSETGHREEFSRPVRSESGGTLRFAGEHTSRNHFATVDGALLSGWREADAILSGMG